MSSMIITFPIEALEAWKLRAKGKLLEFATEVIQDLNNELVIGTPVKFGFLRGSWFAALNSMPQGVGAQDPSGGDSTARMNSVALGLTLGDVYRAANTAIYAARMEYGFFGRDKLGRNYSQPGRGYVRAVVARFQDIATKAAIRVGSRR